MVGNVNKYLKEKYGSPDATRNIPIFHLVTIEKICEDTGSPDIIKDVLTILDVWDQYILEHPSLGNMALVIQA